MAPKARTDFFVRIALTLCLICLVSACGVVTEQSIYEGIRARDQTLPSYEQYKNERELLKK